MINILYIQPYASQVGGVDTVLLELIKGLDCSRYKPYVVLPSYSPYVPKYEEAGACVSYSQLAVFGKPTGLLYYPINILKLFISLYQLRRIVHREQIGIIHSHKMETFGGNLLGKLMRIPTVQTVHELPRKPLAAYKLIAWFNHRLNDRVIVLCERSRSMFQWGARKSRKVTKIYNGIQPSDYEPEPDLPSLRQELGLSNGNIIVVTVARLSPMKGIEYLLAAAASFKREQSNVKFLIVGDVAFEVDKPYKEELLAHVREEQLSDTVLFLGLRRDIPRILAESDLFVLPSVYDIFPTVLLEAMNASLPIVATDVGGVPELVTDEYGLLVPSGHPAALSEAIIEVLSKDYKQMGRRAKEAMRTQFTRDDYVSHTTDVYEELHSNDSYRRAN